MSLLTPREFAAMEKVVEGLKGKAIARALNVEYSTVKHHLDHAKAKLGAASIAQAAVFFDRQTRT